MVKKVSVEEFWKNKEKELNEKLICFSIATYERGHPNYNKTAKGLLYLMSESIVFEDFEKTVWGLPLRKTNYSKTYFRIPIADLRANQIERPPGTGLQQFFRSFIKPQIIYFHLDIIYGGDNKTIIFSDLEPIDNWKHLVDKAIKFKTLKNEDFQSNLTKKQ